MSAGQAGEERGGAAVVHRSPWRARCGGARERRGSVGGYVYAAVAVHLPASPREVFALVTDWPRHREWMVLTSARRVGDRVEAFTGVGPLGFLDVMTIDRWEPPSLVVMRHVGRVVRGHGAIRVRAVPGGSRVIWAERLEPPLGPVGRSLWPLARPVVNALAGVSLRRLGRLLVRAGHEGAARK